MPCFINSFLLALETAVPQDGGKVDRMVLVYCERCMELLVDLLAQLPTRRFLRTLLDNMHVLERCSLSTLLDMTKEPRPEGKLLSQLLDMFKVGGGGGGGDHTLHNEHASALPVISGAPHP